jgi:DNA/RNA endonuclease YhcR with UshA esterase domain
MRPTLRPLPALSSKRYPQPGGGTLKILIAERARRDSNAGMKMLLAILTVLTLASGPVRAEPTNAAAPAKIGAADAVKHYDREMIVTGKVAQVTFRPTIVFLNLDQPHPDSPFTAVIRSEKTNLFGDLKLLEGKSVEVRGKLKKYNGKPEMILDSTNQLTLMDTPAATNTPASK